MDSGRTAVALLEHFKAMGAASVALASLLSKPARRTVPCEPDYLCFEVVSGGQQAVPGVTGCMVCCTLEAGSVVKVGSAVISLL